MSSITTTNFGLEHGDIISDNGTLFKVIRIGQWEQPEPLGSKAFWDEEAVETRIRGGQ